MSNNQYQIQSKTNSVTPATMRIVLEWAKANENCGDLWKEAANPAILTLLYTYWLESVGQPI